LVYLHKAVCSPLVRDETDENNLWVNALYRISVHFEGDNPLKFVNYIITIPSRCFNLSLKNLYVKGLKDKDTIRYVCSEVDNKNLTF